MATTQSRKTPGKAHRRRETRLSRWAALEGPALCHLVLDYGPGDLAGSEVVASVLGHLDARDWNLKELNVGSFDTVETGFCVAQLGMQTPPCRPHRTLIFANCAPRKDRASKRHDNEGEGLVLALLKSGTLVIAVNSGYSLSFVKRDIIELWSTTISKSGSQFRSRDNFPAAVGMAARGDFSFLGRPLNPKTAIPDPPASAVAYVDSFGNIKTSIRSSDRISKSLKSGQRIEVHVNGAYREAFVASGSFNVAEGDFAFAPGSSGHADRFWEIFKRGGSAAAEFGFPKKGAEVEIRLLKRKSQ